MGNTLRFLGHSGWQITTGQGTVLLIDPWLTNNPMAATNIQNLPQADLVLLTHDHFDHASDVVEVAKRTGATLIAQPETTHRYKKDGIPQEQVFNGIGMNIGGSVSVKGITVTMTDAYHTSETGEPAGYIITLEDGKVLYHSGDTGLHYNMKTWGELYDIDLALLPIGSVFTMDARQAAKAVSFLGAKTVIPMHYKTFPVLAPSADPFVDWVGKTAPSAKVAVLEPGETFTL